VSVSASGVGGGVGELEIAIEGKGDGEYAAIDGRWVGRLEVPKNKNSNNR